MTPFEFPQRTFVVAELSANHGHKLETALATVRAAKACGADAIKVQTYTPDTMTLDVDNPLFRISNGSLWDGASFHDLYKDAHLPWEWHAPIRDEALRNGLEFFSSPFDATSVDFLEDLGVGLYKLASFEIDDIPLIEHIASKRRPIIMSTGIASLSQIEEAVSTARRAGATDITLLKCTSAYPALPRDINLLTMPNLAHTFGVRVGLSDHTEGVALPVAAVALGAKVIEKHFILDRSVGGPDASFSLVPEAFADMVSQIRIAEEALGVVTYELPPAAAANRKFGRSLFVAEPVKAGESFTERNLRVIRPGDGLHPRHYRELIGRRAARDLDKGTPVDWSMVGLDADAK